MNNEKTLTRYWFKTGPSAGFGVTAYSLDDAKNLLAKVSANALKQVTEIVDDIDVSTLDSNHILPNVGPSNIRGVWYPFLNL
jgi:hypothetical protein